MDRLPSPCSVLVHRLLSVCSHEALAERLHGNSQCGDTGQWRRMSSAFMASDILGRGADTRQPLPVKIQHGWRKGICVGGLEQGESSARLSTNHQEFGDDPDHHPYLGPHAVIT